MVDPGPGAITSPFSTEPNRVEVELAPAVFAVAPATEWSMVSIEATTPAPAPDQLSPD